MSRSRSFWGLAPLRAETALLAQGAINGLEISTLNFIERHRNALGVTAVLVAFSPNLPAKAVLCVDIGIDPMKGLTAHLFQVA